MNELRDLKDLTVKCGVSFQVWQDKPRRAVMQEENLARIRIPGERASFCPTNQAASREGHRRWLPGKLIDVWKVDKCLERGQAAARVSNQIALFSYVICIGARRDPATCGTN